MAWRWLLLLSTIPLMAQIEPGCAEEDTQTFAERCAMPGVVFCDPLDTEGPYDGAGEVLLNDDMTEGVPDYTWFQNWRGISVSGSSPNVDTDVKYSGTGSLRFDIPSESDDSEGGSFATNFSSDFTVQFAEGESFSLSFKWRADCDFIYFECDPGEPDYKTERRYYGAIGGGTTAAKLAIIGLGDTDTDFANSCTWLEIVLFHEFDHVLTGYHACGWYEGFIQNTGENHWGSDLYDAQPNGMTLGVEDDNPPTCWTMPDVETDFTSWAWGNTGPECFYLDSDQWYEVETTVTIGTWQPNCGPQSGCGEDMESHVTIKAAVAGEAMTTVVDRDVYLRGPEEAGGKYGKVWLLPFMTNKDPTEVHPAAKIWYDELIVWEN